MTPFYFGSADRRLYGAYDPAAGASFPVRAAVLCNPWGPELIEAHRALRHLAAALAKAGIHALRFDYYGTGDSAGETAEGDPQGWCDDILTAADELRDISGATQVTLIGLRHGALLAADAAAVRPDGVGTLLMWDPPAKGDYLAELDATAQRVRRRDLRLTLRPQAEGGGAEIFGFPVSSALVDHFAALHPAARLAAVPVPTRLLVTGDIDAMTRTVHELGADCLSAVAHVPARACWLDDGVSPGGFVPAAVIGDIVRQLA